MVEKSKKILQVFLCLLFAVVLPFSFVGCKKGESNEGNSEKPSITQPSEDNNDESDDNSAQGGNDSSEETLFTATEIVDLFSSTYTLVENYIAKLNDFSGYLSENHYSSTAGEQTALNILTYAYYPNHLVTSLNAYCDTEKVDFELNKVYSYKKNSLEYNFIEMACDDKSGITLFALTKEDETSFRFYKFRIDIEDGNVKNLKISILTTDGSNLCFTDADLNFVNLTLQASNGRVWDTSSKAELFFKTWFTKEKFASFSRERWSGLSFYEKFVFSDGNKRFEKCTTISGSEESDAITDFEANFDNFGFLNAYEIKEQFEDVKDVTFLKTDLIGFVDNAQTKIIYDSKNYKFVKSN